MGSVHKSRQMFDEIVEPDAISYAAMSILHLNFISIDYFYVYLDDLVNAYGLNGLGTQAIEPFKQTPSKLLDEVIYICVLNACSHAGLVDEARTIFHSIPVKNEKIYVTMVNMNYYPIF